MISHEAYFEYLGDRSQLALWYRRYFLYPRLCTHLKGRALDIGCGIGDMLRFRRNTVGVDVNPNAVKWCRSIGLDAVHMDTDHLPFPDGSFDSALLDNVLEHVARPIPLLIEARRILAPAGTLVAGVPGVKGYASDPDHKVFYDEASLKLLLVNAGFHARSIFHMPMRSRWADRHIRQYVVYGVFFRA